jgi:hypothetical protein
VLRSILVVPEVPAVSTDPGRYNVSAEKSRPFNGRFSMVLAVKVVPRVASVVSRMAARELSTSTVSEAPTAR